MMLSDVAIKKFLERGDIVLDPFDAETQIEAARVTLLLGDRILVPQSGVVVDVKNNTVPTYTEHMITKDAPFHLEPRMFILGETREMIGLSERIGCLLDGRSTLARLGLTVVQTAMIIDTGQAPKKMTLEICNHGPNTILLYPGMKFCKACFFLVDPPVSQRYDRDGKYLPGDSHRPIFRNQIF